MDSTARAALADEGLKLAYRHPEVQARPYPSVDRATDFYYHGSVEHLKGQAAVVVGDCACSTCVKLDLLDPERKLALVIDDDGYPQLAFHVRRTSILTPKEFWDRCTPAHLKDPTALPTPGSAVETLSPASPAARRL